MAQHFEHLEGSGESSLLGLLVAGVVSSSPTPPSRGGAPKYPRLCFSDSRFFPRDIQDTNFDNGATQVIVGSHRWPEAAICGPSDRSLCSTCEMSKGDAVFIIGSIWHGAGENRTNPPERRIIYSCHMTRGAMRADENQYLAVDKEVIETYDPEVQALIGYSVSEPFCGHVDLKDPVTLVGGKEDPFNYGGFAGKEVTASG